MRECRYLLNVGFGRRWEDAGGRRAQEARRDAAAWFDLERAPWWLFVLAGVVFLMLGVKNLLSTQTAWDMAWAVCLLAFVVPAQFLTAYRLRRGIPLMQPRPRRNR